MDVKHTFFITLITSILIQIITGGIEIGALFIKVPTTHLLIRQLLILEVIVQIIEGVFYFWLAYNFTKIINVTPKRYIDWAITTPTMLITLVLYLIYLDKRTNDETNKLDFFTLLKDNSDIIIPIVLLNWLMLVIWLFGGNENNTSFAWCIFGVYTIFDLLLYDLCKLCNKEYKRIFVVLVFFLFLGIVWGCSNFTLLYKKFML